MHLYLRLMCEQPETYSAAEQAELQDCLATAPGIESIARVERHPRGGYAVHVQRTADAGPLLAYLAAAGYRVVI
jgi:hypothetical protein